MTTHSPITHCLANGCRCSNHRSSIATIDSRLKEEIKALLNGEKRRARRALLRRRRHSGSRRRNRRLRRRFARDGALRARPSGDDAGRGRRALHGRNREDSVARQTRADADAEGRVFARPRLSARRIRSVLQREQRSHRRGVRQHVGAGESVVRLGGDVEHRAADRRTPRGKGRKGAVGAGQISRSLHSEPNRRRHAAVERRVCGARRVQVQGADRPESDLSRRRRAGAPGEPARR